MGKVKKMMWKILVKKLGELMRSIWWCGVELYTGRMILKPTIIVAYVLELIVIVQESRHKKTTKIIKGFAIGFMCEALLADMIEGVLECSKGMEDHPEGVQSRVQPIKSFKQLLKEFFILDLVLFDIAQLGFAFADYGDPKAEDGPGIYEIICFVISTLNLLYKIYKIWKLSPIHEAPPQNSDLNSIYIDPSDAPSPQPSISLLRSSLGNASHEDSNFNDGAPELDLELPLSLLKTAQGHPMVIDKVQEETKSRAGFAEQHLVETGHPLVMQLDSNGVLWCFTCGNFISAPSFVENKTHCKITKKKNLKMITTESTRDANGLCRFHVRGMQNQGNTCYYNAVLQNLLSLEVLRDHYTKATYARGSCGYMMKDLYLATDQNSQRAVLQHEHDALLDKIRIENPDKFHVRVQEDSYELLLALFGSLTDSASQSFIENTFGIGIMETLTCECGQKNGYHDFTLALSIPCDHIIEEGNSFKAIANKMTGRSGEIKTVSERAETSRKDPELQSVVTKVEDVAADKESRSADASIGAVRGSERSDSSKAETGCDSYDVSKAADLSKEAADLSVERALPNMMWAKESETDQVCLCKKSCKGRPAIVSFTKEPVILVLHLKRYGYQNGVGYKIHGHMAFKETLIYGQGTLGGSSDGIDAIYQLKGVVEHIGNFKEGHYIAYVKGGCPGEDWLSVSDEQVNPVTLEEVLGCEAYLLFYERIT